MPGILVVLSGPSAIGKDTVLSAWKQLDPMIVVPITTTTREPRPGEQNGVDYHFVSPQEFQRKIDRGEFLEWKPVYHSLYGSPKAETERILAEGKIAVLKLDVQGAKTVKQTRSDAITIFLMPPSLQALEERIRSRNLDSEEQVRIRLEAAKNEIAQACEFDYQVINDDVQSCAKRLDEIVRKAMAQ